MRIVRRLAPPRFLIFALVLLAASGAALALLPDPTVALLAGFDVAAVVFLLSVWPLLDDDTGAMRRRSKDNDANRVALLAITVLIGLVILVAVGALIASGKGMTAPRVALIVATLVLSWVFSNTVFALHYAHLYYLPHGRGDHGGLDFPGDDTPDYWDFLYFSFTLGMTFQTSDVPISASHLRRVALGHTMAAFVFNLGVIAFVVNALGSR